MEAALIALSDKAAEDMEPHDYMALLSQLGWRPRVSQLSEAESAAGPGDGG